MAGRERSRAVAGAELMLRLMFLEGEEPVSWEAWGEEGADGTEKQNCSSVSVQG